MNDAVTGGLIGITGTLLGVGVESVFTIFRDRRARRRRQRIALATIHMQLNEALFLAQQLAVHHKASPQGSQVSFEFPAFYEYLADLDSVLSDETMGRIAKIVVSAGDMTALYRRAISAGTPGQQVNPITELQQYATDLDAARAAVRCKAADFA